MSAVALVGEQIRVDWVQDLESLPRFRGVVAAGGGLGMTVAPGRRDVAALRGVERVDTFVLLIEDHELELLDDPGIAAAMAEAGIELLRFAIVDGSVPVPGGGFRSLLDDLLARLARGQRVVVACRAGLGRTGTLVGCLLRDGGLDGDSAIATTRASRPDTIENERQEAYVNGWDWPPREALA